MPLEKAKDAITDDIRMEKKKALILDELKNIDCSSLESVAQAKALNVQTSSNLSFASTSGPGIGIEPVLFATMAQAEKDVVSKPIVGERGVYVAKVTNTTDAEVSTIENEKTTQAQRAASMKNDRVKSLSFFFLQ